MHEILTPILGGFSATLGYLLALALSAEQETDLPVTTPTCAKCGATCEIIPTGWRCPKCEQEPK